MRITLSAFVIVAFAGQLISQEQSESSKAIKDAISILRKAHDSAKGNDREKIVKALAALEPTLNGEPETIGPLRLDGKKKFYSLKVGDVGTLDKLNYKMDNAISNASFCIVRIEGTSFRFIVSKADFSNIADGDRITLPGIWRVDVPTTYLGTKYPTVQAKQGARIVQR